MSYFYKITNYKLQNVPNFCTIFDLVQIYMSVKGEIVKGAVAEVEDLSPSVLVNLSLALAGRFSLADHFSPSNFLPILDSLGIVLNFYLDLVQLIPSICDLRPLRSPIEPVVGVEVEGNHSFGCTCHSCPAFLCRGILGH